MSQICTSCGYDNVSNATACYRCQRPLEVQPKSAPAVAPAHVNLTLPVYEIEKAAAANIPISLLDQLHLLELTASGDPVERIVRMVRRDTSKPVRTLYVIIGKGDVKSGFVVTEGSWRFTEKTDQIFVITRASLHAALQGALIDFYG